MLPGWIAGHYRLEQACIDIRSMCERAGVRWVAARVVALDANRCRVHLCDGQTLSYERLSLDVGGETDVRGLQAAGTRLVPVKPLDRFIAAWPRVLAQASARARFRLCVVGGGAAGVELALAARYALRCQAPEAEVILVTGSGGVLPGHAGSVRRRAARQLQRAAIAVRVQRAAGGEQGVVLDDGEVVRADVVLAATGARPPAWLADSGLRCDEAGFVAVDAHHRSVSHPNVYAAGDVCYRVDVPLQRSGVHAVRAGPVLAHNLLASPLGATPLVYRPRRYSLYLLACGRRYAIASWGPLSAEGAWVWRWKDAIDRRFVARFPGGVVETNQRENKPCVG